jgi:hypothetical protein
MTFDDFAEVAGGLFGLEGGELNELASLLDAAGAPLEAYEWDDKDFWELASDAGEEILEGDYTDEDFERYPLDRFFPGDEYLEPDIEWEITAESEEGYGD